MNKLNKLILCLGLLALIYIYFPSSSIADDNEDFLDGVQAAEQGDFISALKFWQPLAEKGFKDAQFNLAVMYERGKGVPQNYKTAVKWYTLAAEQGHAKSQYNIGVMYNNGEGVPQDYKAAVKYYTLAAEQGIAEAQFNLAFMYESGKGVPQNYIKAYMWVNLAAAGKEEKKIRDKRDILVKKMTPVQIDKAQEYSNRCVKQYYKNCDF